jgi:hypothetical protein
MFNNIDMKEVEERARVAQTEVDENRVAIANEVTTWAGAISHKSVEVVWFDYGNGNRQVFVRGQRTGFDPISQGV